ncbi:MAG: ribonuclease P protein component [Candidatus Paceibacteria bacterium]|jgi:ribonuclease P protein component
MVSCLEALQPLEKVFFLLDVEKEGLPYLHLTDNCYTGYMLPKKERLNRGEIETIKKGGNTISSPFFRIKYVKNKGFLKLAPVVSKKVSDNAVERNSIRKEIYRFAETNKEKLQGFSILVFLQKKIKKEDISSELTKLLTKIK